MTSLRIRFWRLPGPPRRLPRPIRALWLALSLWRGWPADAGEGLAYDPFADIGAREALGMAWRLEGPP